MTGLHVHFSVVHLFHNRASCAFITKLHVHFSIVFSFHNKVSSVS